MTYLRMLRFAANIIGRLMARCDVDGLLWAELADIGGRVAMRQIDYAKNVQKASGWEPVEVIGPRIAWPYALTVSSGTTVSGVRINGVPIHEA